MTDWATRQPADPIPVPLPGAPMAEIMSFALTYNAYDRHGPIEVVRAIATDMRRNWDDAGVLDPDVGLLRCALFFEQRRAHHIARSPIGPDRDYVEALVAEIARQTGGSVPGPPDPPP